MCQRLEGFPSNISAMMYPHDLTPMESELQKGIPVLQNLNEILKPLRTSNCFIHVTIFHTTFDFPGELLQFPVIFRRLFSHKLVTYRFNRRRKKIVRNEKLIWMKHQIKHFVIHNNNSFLTKYCHNSFHSNIRKVSPLYTQLCVQLDILNFSMKAKPWGCEVYMGMFPPSVSFQNNYKSDTYLSYPGVWYLPRDPPNRWSFPSGISKINIIFINDKLHNEYLESNRYADWAQLHFEVPISGSRLSGLSDLSSDVFFIILTKREMKGLAQIVETAKSIWNFLVCLNCDSFQYLIGNHLREVPRQEWNDLILVSANANQLEGEAHWHISLESSEIFGQDLIMYFNHCDKQLYSDLSSQSAIEFSNRAIVQMWQVIMKNFTYPIYEKEGPFWSPSDKLCSCGEKISQKYTNPFASINLNSETSMLLSDFEVYHVSVPNDLFALPFVSCGRLQMSSLAFKELFSIFHRQIWLFAGLTLIKLILFKSIVVDYHKICRRTLETIFLNVLGYLKILVEQGDAFLESYSNHWKFSYSLYLLMSIVLSNAYRNSNVYNMVKPRIPIPYEKFSQLVDDKFKIFTRNVEFVNFEEILDGETVNMSNAMTTPHTIWFLSGHKWYLMSEVQKFKVLIDYHDKPESVRTDQHAENLQRVMNHSELHPNLIKIFNEIAFEYIQTKIDNLSVIDHSWWSRKMHETEQSILEESLDHCNQVALLLPDHLARNIAYRMRNLENIYVGKEILQDSMTAFYLSGYIPLRIISRIKAIKWAGLWYRWRKLIWSKTGRTVQENVRESRKIQKPTMSGNIFVIFVVLLIGLSCSILAFLGECFRQICHGFVLLVQAMLVLFKNKGLV